jgi:triacylglycerol lipase
MEGVTSRRWLLAAVVAAVLAAALAVVGGRVLDEDRPPVVAAPQDLPGPVLLVPGYGGATGALEVLAERLRADGRSAAVVGLPGDGTGDHAVSAAVVAARVTAEVAAGAPSVDLVGYSAGGVVARYAVAELGLGGSVRRVVTLGSPHHGTSLASAGALLAPDRCPIACRQLVPDGDFLDALNAGDETPAGPSWLSAWTADDQVVTPPESARLDGAVNVALQDLCPGVRVTHGQLPTAVVVSGLVRTALSAAPLVAPTDCATVTAAGR